MVRVEYSRGIIGSLMPASFAASTELLAFSTVFPSAHRALSGAPASRLPTVGGAFQLLLQRACPLPGRGRRRHCVDPRIACCCCCSALLLLLLLHPACPPLSPTPLPSPSTRSSTSPRVVSLAGTSCLPVLLLHCSRCPSWALSRYSHPFLPGARRV